MDHLTGKQEKFAQGVASGMTQADAYRAAYNSERMLAKTIQENASRIAARSKVKARIDELKKELVDRKLWTWEQSIEALKGVINQPDKAGDITAAVKELNAMHGFNAPKKVEMGGEVNIIDKSQAVRIALEVASVVGS